VGDKERYKEGRDRKKRGYSRRNNEAESPA